MIGRSAISAAVTLLVGIVWTLSMDMLKVGVEWVLGEENTTVATIAGAVDRRGHLRADAGAGDALGQAPARRRREPDQAS